MIKSLLLSCLLLLAGHEAKAEACTLVKIAELHVTIENNRILIPGEMAGHKVKFLFDTSYPASLITANTARSLGIPVRSFGQAEQTPQGVFVSREDVGLANLHGFSLDGYEGSDDIEVGVFSPGDNFGGPDVLGVLGSDFWGGYDVEIDLQHNLIKLFHAKGCDGHNLAYWGSDYNVIAPVQYGARTEVKIKLNGQNITAIIDSGSPHSTITERAAHRLGLRQGDAKSLAADVPQGTQPTDLLSLIRFAHGIGLYITPPPNILADGLPGIEERPLESSYWIGRFDRLQMDEEVIAPMSFRVVPTPPPVAPPVDTRIPYRLVEYDVLLGVDFLKAHRMLLANSQGKMYFTYTGGTDFAKPN